MHALVTVASMCLCPAYHASHLVGGPHQCWCGQMSDKTPVTEHPSAQLPPDAVVGQDPNVPAIKGPSRHVPDNTGNVEDH